MNLRHSSSPYGKFTWRIAALALAFATLGACSDDPEPTAPPEEIDITLNETSVTLVRTLGETAQIEAEVSGTSNTDVQWTVHNPAVATVSATGLVTPLADGSTFVTARSAADPTVNRSVVVNVVSTIVTTNPPTIYSWVGGPSRQLTATVQNNANTAVTWHSANTAIATVDANGLASPVATGTVEVYAQSVAQTEKRGISSFIIDPSAATVLADFAPDASGALTSGTGQGGISGAARGNYSIYYIAVPQGATQLAITLAGPAQGDADIYVYRGRIAGSTLVCESWNAGNSETCVISNPQSRIYYVYVDTWDPYSGATLTATVTPTP